MTRLPIPPCFDPDPEAIAAAIGVPVAEWAKSCHAISAAVVRAQIVKGRVARGFCEGVPGQHSWVVLGDNCYDPDARVLDLTLWSYVEDEPVVWLGYADERPHRPHGAGSIWEWGKPAAGDGPPLGLTPAAAANLSPAARDFLDLLGPLDRKGWHTLLSAAPVEGWPAGEILAAADATHALAALVPIDRLGMLTDLNPGGLYLPGDDRRAR